MPVTAIHENMRRCLLNDDGSVNAYLDESDSHYLAGKPATISGAAGAGTSGLTLSHVGAFAGVQAGQYIKNITKDTYFQVLEVISDDELLLQAPLATAGTNWGDATETTANKLTDSAATFNSDGILVGMIVAKRDLSDYAIVTNVDSETELSLSKDIFVSGDAYTIMQGFQQGDNYEVCTAVLNGDEGQVMVEIPFFWYKHQQGGKAVDYSISASYDPRKAAYEGFEAFPAFVRPDGSHRKYIYVSAFEGSVDETDFSGEVLTNYNLTSATLKSAAGLRPVTNGQRSEYRQAAGNNGPGWQIIDWYTNFAWQLLMMIELEDLNSQDALGDGLTTWSSGQRDGWVVNTSNRAVNHTGYSLRNGNGTVNANTGAGNASGVLSWRGIENPYGNIWKWLDGVNYNDGRVYLANDAEGYEDDSGLGVYFDTGVTQPDSNGYISEIHNTPHGFLVKEANGSSSTYLSDYYWYNTGWRVALAGGGVNAGDRAGFAALSANASAGPRNAFVGSRVCFRD